MDARLIRDVQGAESCRLTAYKDSRGLWTIGWGHLLDQSRDWSGTTWTQEQADATLGTDISVAATACLRLPEFPFLDTPCRQNAVTELVFNMGPDRWKGFVHCRLALQRRDWQTAHDELLSSAWREQVHDTRANRLANYLLTGQYPA